MTSDQIALVQSSFSRMAPLSIEMSDYFFDTLFSRAPAMRQHFSDDLVSQGSRLLALVTLTVRELNHPGNLQPALSSLGECQLDQGWTCADYQHVGDALLATLKNALQEHFTEDVERAWEQTYQLIAGIMIAAAQRRAANNLAVMGW